ncbi:MAG TPA: amino acid ABC transporter permease [Verrucomicrobiales bacterium]|nr:amino acid ABC transporter permease [Verrucomicrobiales bacterium]
MRPAAGRGRGDGLVQAAGWMALIVALAGLCYLFFVQTSYHYRWESIADYRKPLFLGWLATLGLAAASLAASSVIGLLTTLGRRSRIGSLRFVCGAYVELARGTPLLVQILVGFYLVFDRVGIRDKWIAGVLILSFFAGAYLSEIFRAGIQSVARSQLDAARAVGFNAWQTYRFVIVPQAFRNALPAVTGQFANLIKDSSLLSVIGVLEFTKQAESANAATYSTFEVYLPLALGYLALTIPIFWLARWMEGRLHFQT